MCRHKQIFPKMIKRHSQFFAFVTALVAIVTAALAASVPVGDWKIAGPFGGTATVVAVDPNNTKIVLAGAMNSLLFQSKDAGASWDMLNLPKLSLSEVTTVLIDPRDSNHYLAGMMAAEGGGLFESHNQGKTWSAANGVSDFGVRALAASASDPSHFVAGTLRGVMLSTNSGKSWKRISDPQNLEMQGITAVAIDPKDPNVIYAGTPHLPWRTVDGGKTWESIHTGMIDDSDVFSIYVDPFTPTSIFASACSGIYSSDNRGDLWHKLMGIPNTSRRTHVVRWQGGSCCGDPSTSGAVYAGTTTGLFRSLNRGTTWKTLTDEQVNSIAFDSNAPSTMYLALEYAGLAKSNDGGGAIEPINNGFVDRVISSVTTSGNKLVALETQEGETSGIFFSSDRGESWWQLRKMRGLAEVHLDTIAGISGGGGPGQDHTLLAASPHQIYKSIDEGITWKPIPVRLIVPPPPEPEKKASKTPVRPGQRGKSTARVRTLHPVKPKPTIKDISPSEISALYSLKSGASDVIFAATDLGLLKSADLGEHWTMAAMGEPAAVTALYSAPNSDGQLIARAAGGLYVSKDFGDHWTIMPFPLPASDINQIAIPADPAAPLLVATRVGLYSSPNGGAEWYTVRAGIPASTVNSVVYAGSGLDAYAVGYGRLYETKDGGNSWSEISTLLPSLRIRQLWMPDNNSSRLYGITSDLGIIFRD